MASRTARDYLRVAKLSDSEMAAATNFGIKPTLEAIRKQSRVEKSPPDSERDDIIDDLHAAIAEGKKWGTIYADPALALRQPDNPRPHRWQRAGAPTGASLALAGRRFTATPYPGNAASAGATDHPDPEKGAVRRPRLGVRTQIRRLPGPLLSRAGSCRFISRNGNVLGRLDALCDQVAVEIAVDDAILDGEVIVAARSESLEPLPQSTATVAALLMNRGWLAELSAL
jgi:hypothetical protein